MFFCDGMGLFQSLRQLSALITPLPFITMCKKLLCNVCYVLFLLWPQLSPHLNLCVAATRVTVYTTSLKCPIREGIYKF